MLYATGFTAILCWIPSNSRKQSCYSRFTFQRANGVKGPYKYHLWLPNSTNFDDFRSVFLFRHNHFHFSDSIGKLLLSSSVLESSLAWFLLLLIVFASCTYLYGMFLKTNCKLPFVNKCLRVTSCFHEFIHSQGF